MNDDLYTFAEVVEILKEDFSKATIYRMFRNKKIPSILDEGGRLKIKKTEFKEWYDEYQNEKNIKKISVSEAAEIAKVSERTIRRAMQTGKLAIIKTGGKVEISYDEFLKWEGSENKPSDPEKPIKIIFSNMGHFAYLPSKLLKNLDEKLEEDLSYNQPDEKRPYRGGRGYSPRTKWIFEICKTEYGIELENEEDRITLDNRVREDGYKNISEWLRERARMYINK